MIACAAAVVIAAALRGEPEVAGWVAVALVADVGWLVASARRGAAE